MYDCCILGSTLYLLCTVSQNETPHSLFVITLASINHFSTCFNYPFTVAFYSELLKMLYNPPPYLKSFAALPCEIWMFSCTTLHDSYVVFDVWAVSFGKWCLPWYICTVLLNVCRCQAVINAAKRATFHEIVQRVDQEEAEDVVRSFMHFDMLVLHLCWLSTLPCVCLLFYHENKPITRFNDWRLV